MSSPPIWSSGQYEAVALRIAPIATEVVDAVERRVPVCDAMLIDLACGTGNAALVAAARGARVTAVDITPELIAIGARDAEAAGRPIAWLTADASDTGLPGASFDAAVSNMGTIFVEPVGMVAEMSRLLKPGGAVAFSSWVRDPANPFFTPIVEVLGPPPRPGYSPDQWGETDTITARLAPDFDDIDIQRGWAHGISTPWPPGCTFSRANRRRTWTCSIASTRSRATGCGPHSSRPWRRTPMSTAACLTRRRTWW
jgi:SAM-dependent methyltransferase